MKLVLLSALAAAATVASLAPLQRTPLDRSAKSLLDAASLTATFIQISGVGSPTPGTLQYSKPEFFRVDTATRLTVSDGKTVWELNKKDNTFTETPASLDRILEDDLAGWAPFFARDAFKDAKAARNGAKRTIKTVPVQELIIDRANGSSVTLYLDTKTGVNRGISAKKGDDDLTTFATQLDLSATPIAPETFTFVAPTGAKRVAKAEPPSYSRVASIFKAACLGCHQPGKVKGGFDLSTYEALMAGGRSGPAIVAGDPKASLLLQLVNGSKQPAMPRGAAPLTVDQVKAIETWIAAGAKPTP